MRLPTHTLVRVVRSNKGIFFLHDQNEKQVRNIYLNDNKLIPEVEGTAFSIEDANTTRKCEALYFILKELEKGLNTK